MKDREPRATSPATAWRAIEARGAPIAVRDDWKPLPGDGASFGDARARVDVRAVDAGSLIDPGYVRNFAGAIGAGERDCTFVKVRGRTAVRCRSSAKGLHQLVWCIADAPRPEGDGVRYPETRIVYVSTSAWNGAEESIRAVIEDPADDFDARVRAHPCTAEGRLEFGPFPTGSDWRLLGEDGKLVDMPPPETDPREVHCGGGFLALVSPAQTANGIANLQFQPRIRAGTDPEAMLEASRGLQRRLAAQGFTVTPTSEGPIALPFDTHAWRSTFDIRRGAATGVMCIYGWRDVLGYDWELAYTVPSDQWPAWQCLLARLG